ncbi:MAG: hypothetical protein KTR25_02660 [Myxococcales bacterium]|nr:hypothetical protein [Myxococcales bacterium]
MHARLALEHIEKFDGAQIEWEIKPELRPVVPPEYGEPQKPPPPFAEVLSIP